MPREPQLRFISGKYQGGLFSLAEGSEVVMGRGMDAGLTLFEEMVSRHHARFSCSGGVVTVLDLGSKNGTFVNGDRIEERQLSIGDRILMGTSILRLEMGEAQANIASGLLAEEAADGATEAAALETMVPTESFEEGLQFDESEFAAMVGEERFADDGDTGELEADFNPFADDESDMTSPIGTSSGLFEAVEDTGLARWGDLPQRVALSHPMQPSLEFLNPEQLSALQAAHNHNDLDEVAAALRKDDGQVNKLITFLLRSGYLRAQ